MIVVLTTRDHGYTLRRLAQRDFGFPTPRVAMRPYERLFRSARVPRATYIFADLERLAPWELRIAAALYRALTGAGLRCLNDPARAMTRFELLHALHASGVNSYAVLRADVLPRPERFPVFLRFEGDHGYPLSALIADQAELDRCLAGLQAKGIPRAGVLVLEHCPAPYGDGLFHKWGTFRVGSRLSVDHLAVEDSWIVKRGMWGKLTPEAIADEHDAVQTNRFARELKPVFDLASIEFGRADHATVNGQTVVYEINTNPWIGAYVPDPYSVRRATQTLARRRLAAALAAIDTPSSGMVAIEAPAALKPYRSWTQGWLLRKRP